MSPIAAGQSSGSIIDQSVSSIFKVAVKAGPGSKVPARKLQALQKKLRTGRATFPLYSQSTSSLLTLARYT